MHIEHVAKHIAQYEDSTNINNVVVYSSVLIHPTWKVSPLFNDLPQCSHSFQDR